MDNRKYIRTNRQINSPEVRLIDEEGTNYGVVSTAKAMEMAQERGLDLVEVSPGAKPPVCKIIDYGKYKYWKKKKEHVAKKHQTVIHLKEVKFRPRIDIHDFQVKMKKIREFLDEGNKVKASVVFRGREMAYQEQGSKILEKISQEVSDVGKVDILPKREGRILTMVLSALKS